MNRDFVQIYVPLAQDPVDDMLMLVRSWAAGALTPAVRTDLAHRQGTTRERGRYQDA